MTKYNERIINILHLLPREVREKVNIGRVEEILFRLTEREGATLELR
jgi:hypothetical protein